MLEVEVLVAPFLEARVVIPHRFPARGVEMLRVFFEPVVRREIHAAAEPPHVASGEIAHVQVNRRAIRIARMQDERHAHRFPGPAGEMRARSRGGGRQLLALHMRQVDAAALEEIALFDDSRYSSAALRTLPCVRLERTAVERFECRHDPVLQVSQIFEDLHFRLIARWPMSLRYCMPSKRM